MINIDDLKYVLGRTSHELPEIRREIKRCQNLKEITSPDIFFVMHLFVKYLLISRPINEDVFNNFNYVFYNLVILVGSWPEMEEKIREFGWTRTWYEKRTGYKL